MFGQTDRVSAAAGPVCSWPDDTARRPGAPLGDSRRPRETWEGDGGRPARGRWPTAWGGGATFGRREETREEVLCATTTVNDCTNMVVDYDSYNNNNAHNNHININNSNNKDVIINKDDIKNSN